MSIRAFVSQQIRRYEQQYDTYNNILISRSAILNNFDYLQNLGADLQVIPVLKANAYGHGIEEVASILSLRSFPYLAVDGYFEALRIRAVSKQAVLIMGAIKPSNFSRINLKNFAFVVHDETTLAGLAATGKTVKVHLELETGMSRHGIRLSELKLFLKSLKKYPRLHVEGVMTHLADADNPSSTVSVKQQTERFDQGVEQVRAAGYNPRYLHIAQSAGSVKVRSQYANTLRVGLALYGISPLEESDKYAAKLSGLRPALSFKTTITKVLNLDAGDTVSYGRTYKADKPVRIGVVPIGYYEGVPRSLSNSGDVEYKKTYLPIAGRVCMNHTMINLDNSKAKQGDEVLFISSDRSSRANVEAIARLHQIFSYSLLVGLNQNVRRIIVD